MRQRRAQSGLTIMEVMIACAVLAFMMAMAWRTIASTATTKKTVIAFEQRNHEIRMALRRVVADFESAYLSSNEDPNLASTHPRTMMVARSGSNVPEVRFSTMGHRPLWADANESEQTVVSYLEHQDRERNTLDWVRREQRRLSNENPEQEPAEYDVLLRDVEKVEIDFWSWKNQEWQDTWNTTQSDGQRGLLPSRVRITVTVKDAKGESVKHSTQARILMQEPLLFNPS